MKTRLLFLAFVLLLLATGCSRSASAPPPSATATTSSGDVSRARVVTADIALTVDRVDEVIAKLRDEVERGGGWIADANVYGDPGERSAHVDVRVPAKDLKKLRGVLAAYGEITSHSEHVQDVTESRADLDARLHNARIQEKRIVELLTSRTGTLSEIIEAEKELARVRENVERLEAQKNALSTQIEFATVRVSIATRTTPAWQTPGTSLKRAGANGLRAGAAFAVYGGMALVTIAPTVAPIAIVVIGLVLAIRRRRRVAFAG